MEKMIQLFEEFIMKAITITESALALDPNDGDKLTYFTENRERLLSIVDSISKQIDWSNVEESKLNDLNKQIDYIKKLDEKLLVKLQEHKLSLKQDIEKTFRQKENIKGYNLTDVK